MRRVVIVGLSLFIAGCGAASSTPDGGGGGAAGGGAANAGGGLGSGGGLASGGGTAGAVGGGTTSTGGGTAAGGGGGASQLCTSCHALAALATGSHQAHVAPGAVSSGFDCVACHTMPTDSAHASQPLDLTFGALAKTGGLTPTYDAATHTCASVACHGATTTTPAWGTTSTLGCDGCHGNPPTSTWHTGVATGPTTCATCHAWTVDSTGKILLTQSTTPEFGARHIDGVAQGHHPWTSQQPPGHILNINITLCNSCHRQQVADPYKTPTLPAGTISVCSQCH